MRGVNRTMRKRTTALAVVIAAALITAGCGSSSKGKTSANPSTGPSSTGGATPTGKPKVLKIASIAYSTYFGDLAVGVKTRLADANANNDVPGYKFDYLGLINDQYTTPGTVAAYRQAKEQDGVFAVVGAGSPAPPTDYINSNQLPTVDGAGESDAFCTHGATTQWYAFAVVGCAGSGNTSYYLNLGQPSAAYLGSASGKSVACVGEDFPNGEANMKKLCGSMEAAGFKVALTTAAIPAPPTVVSDYSPYVQKIMTANGGKPVDAVAEGTDPGVGIGLAQALQRAGYKGLIIGGLGYSPALTQGFKGVTQWSNFAAPIPGTTNAQLQKIIADLVKGGTPASKISTFDIEGWAAADMFVQIAKKAGANLTAQSFAKTASSFTYQVAGVAGPTTYPIAFAAGTPCSELDQSTGTSWKVVRPYTCDQVYQLSPSKFVDYSSIDPNKKS